jgi:2-keto-4-pentenoate hydratase/2-oxohepta-3-ene-1,7-dioic acid hydratase in catechol pathway
LADGKLELLSGAPWEGTPSGAFLDPATAQFCAPAEPSKIICVGLNYKDHAAEMGSPLPAEPLIFLKALSALQDPGKPVKMPPMSSRVDYEAELAMVIGRNGTIFGYTCANDVTARDLQKKDGQWSRAKGFDTFCPLGPYLVEGLDPRDLAVECRVNGVLKQSGRTSNLIFRPEQILAFISQVMTLLPGDVILSGTPAGIGPLAKGDQVKVSIESIGDLENPVI